MSWIIFWLLQFKAWIISLWIKPKVKEAQELQVNRTEIFEQSGKIATVKFHLSDGSVHEPLRGFCSDQEALNLIRAWKCARLRRTVYGNIVRI
jgi:hypothetical protein